MLAPMEGQKGGMKLAKIYASFPIPFQAIYLSNFLSLGYAQHSHWYTATAHIRTVTHHHQPPPPNTTTSKGHQGRLLLWQFPYFLTNIILDPTDINYLNHCDPPLPSTTPPSPSSGRFHQTSKKLTGTNIVQKSLYTHAIAYFLRRV